MKEFNPPDDSIKNRVRCIDYKRTFHDKDTFEGDTTDPEFRSADKSLGDKFKTNVEYKDALVSIFIDAYQKYKKEGHKMPDSIAESSKAWSGVQVTFKQRIEKYFEITKKDDDFVTNDNIIDFIKKKEGLDMSDTKIGIEMRKLLGYGSIIKTINKISHRGYIGVKNLIKIEDDEEY
jgi:hypothetical protein